MASDDGEQQLIETEQKFDVPTGFELPSLTGPGVASMAPPDLLQLSATYFDTAGLHLAAAKITLRRRTGGTDAGWHIKLPVSADTRRELHFPLTEAEHEVPAPVAAEVAQWTGGQPLRPVARLETRRTVRRLTGPDGLVLAEVADDTVTGSRPDPADPARWRQADRWREIEVELVSGHHDLLNATAGQLRAAGAEPSRSASKLARVLGTG
jgi:inorganic triphosphatase YgiF